MTTAGMAAASPNAVASSASAMPGATTARLVVCDFEIPIKLFMMPHTVPNRLTKGAVAPNRRQHAGAADHLAAAIGLDAFEPGSYPLLDGIAVHEVIREPQFLHGCIDKSSNRPIGIAESLRGFADGAH